MKYAVVQFLGKQYQVTTGDVFTVDRIPNAVGEEVQLSDVLLTVNDSDVAVGQPVVKGAKVICKVVEHQKGDKIRVAKYRAKSRYRKTQGHRQLESTLEVVKIA